MIDKFIEAHSSIRLALTVSSTSCCSMSISSLGGILDTVTCFAHVRAVVSKDLQDVNTCEALAACLRLFVPITTIMRKNFSGSQLSWIPVSTILAPDFEITTSVTYVNVNFPE